MSKKINIEPNIMNTILALDEMSMAKVIAIVKDHYICYGSSLPLCGQKLGKKGIIKEEKYITCPECLKKLSPRTETM